MKRPSDEATERRKTHPGAGVPHRGKPWNWPWSYEGFAVGCVLAAIAVAASVMTLGCSLHLHFGEKSYHGEATERRSDVATKGEEPTIEANPHGEPGIEIVIPEKE